MTVKTKRKYKSDVILGRTYRDNITGIQGTAICLTFHLHACEQMTVEYADKDCEKSLYFTADVARFIDVETGNPLVSKDEDQNGASARPVASRHRNVS